MTPAERVKRIMDEAVGRDLSSWERFTFLPDVARFKTLTANQEKVLALIEARLFGDDEQ